MLDAQKPEDPVSVFDGGVSEDDLLGLNLGQDSVQGLVGLEIVAQGNVVDVGQIVFGINVVVDLETLQGGAIGLKVVTAQIPGRHRIQAHSLLNILVDALADGRHQPCLLGIEGIVQVKKDVLDHAIGYCLPFQNGQKGQSSPRG